MGSEDRGQERLRGKMKIGKAMRVARMEQVVRGEKKATVIVLP